MVDILKQQIRKFEQTAKPYLYEGPFTSYWSFIEEKTKNKVKRDQIALGLIALSILYLTFGWNSDFLCNLAGFLYPAYASLLSIESTKTDNDTKWLIYWVIYASLSLIEYTASSFIESIFFYWLGKFLFLIWLMKPGPLGGSNFLYQRLIHPLMPKSRPTNNNEFSQRDTDSKQYSSSANN